MYIHGENDFFFSQEKLRVRKISRAWLLSLIYEGSDLTMGVMILSK